MEDIDIFHGHLACYYGRFVYFVAIGYLVLFSTFWKNWQPWFRPRKEAVAETRSPFVNKASKLFLLSKTGDIASRTNPTESFFTQKKSSINKCKSGPGQPTFCVTGSFFLSKGRTIFAGKQHLLS
jgi:hypothetical protein